MENQNTASAMKNYLVWAKSFVSQFVEASSPEEAVRIAEASPWNFEKCGAGRDNYAIERHVLDVDSGEEVPVGPVILCKTCGSKMVGPINGSNFAEGECGRCEYDRYKSQPSLLETGFLAYGALCDLSYHWCFRGKAKRFQEANETMDKLATALNAYGKEQ